MGSVFLSDLNIFLRPVADGFPFVGVERLDDFSRGTDHEATVGNYRSAGYQRACSHDTLRTDFRAVHNDSAHSYK